jgi:tetratricopeptide (TPR) repeat protein
MTKVDRVSGGLIVGLSFVLALYSSAAHAQAPAPKTPAPTPEQKDGPTPQTGEKADTTDNLQKGTQGGERPWAVGISPEQQKAALAKFREANEMLNNGLFARAANAYKEALKSWPHPAIHYNLALALMNVDQPIEAYDNLERSMLYGEQGPLEKDKFEHAKEYMVLLEKQIANIEVSCDKPGAKVSVDGKEVFVAPGTFKSRVRIGKHTFVAEKTGYSTRINAPFIGPGDNFRIELKLYTAEELTRYNRRWDATWMPWTVIGVGVALGVAGVAMELSATSAYKDYDKAVEACNMNNAGCPTDAAITDLRDSGDSKKSLGYVLYGAAGVTAVAGIVLAVMNRQQPYQIRPEDLQEEQARAGKVSFTPIVSPTMAGAMVQGHF